MNELNDNAAAASRDVASRKAQALLIGHTLKQKYHRALEIYNSLPPQIKSHQRVTTAYDKLIAKMEEDKQNKSNKT